MTAYKRAQTTTNVWSLILVAHENQLVVFHYSVPINFAVNDIEEGFLKTEYFFENSQLPIMVTETRFKIKQLDADRFCDKYAETTLYYLCLPTKARHKNS